MDNEMRDIGFTGDIRIPKEIQNIKAEVFAGMDVRELKYIGVGAVLALITAFIVFGMLHQTGTLATMAPALVFAPFLIMAKIKKNGMNMEDWLLICYSNHFKSRPVRVNEVVNDYEKLEALYKAKFEKKQPVVKAKGKSKELKARKKASPYRACL